MCQLVFVPTELLVQVDPRRLIRFLWLWLLGLRLGQDQWDQCPIISRRPLAAKNNNNSVAGASLRGGEVVKEGIGSSSHLHCQIHPLPQPLHPPSPTQIQPLLAHPPPLPYLVQQAQWELVMDAKYCCLLQQHSQKPVLQS